jgi:hypothetical protein
LKAYLILRISIENSYSSTACIKIINIRATHKEVEFINKQAVNQVHKPVLNIKSQEKPTVAVDENSQMYIDLIDCYKYK